MYANSTTNKLIPQLAILGLYLFLHCESVFLESGGLVWFFHFFYLGTCVSSRGSGALLRFPWYWCLETIKRSWIHSDGPKRYSVTYKNTLVTFQKLSRNYSYCMKAFNDVWKLVRPKSLRLYYKKSTFPKLYCSLLTVWKHLIIRKMSTYSRQLVINSLNV